VALSPTDNPPESSQARFYGYGYRVSVVGNQRIFGHSGQAFGGATNIDIFPDLDWVAVVLGNYDTTITPIAEAERQLISRPGN
jgi:hypothetical protein